MKTTPKFIFAIVWLILALLYVVCYALAEALFTGDELKHKQPRL